MTKPEKFKIEPKKYQEIMRGVELAEIRCEKFGAELLKSFHGKIMTIDIVDTSKSETEGTVTLVRQKYSIKATEEKARTPSLKAEVHFLLRLTSKEPLTEEFMEVFRELNLPLNTWPYFREFVASTVARFGMPPLTLPFRKN